MNLNYLKGTATFKIIILNIICFVLTAAGTLFAGTFANNYYLTVGQFQLYRLVTSMFYHYGFLHILCNMMSLSNISFSFMILYIYLVAKILKNNYNARNYSFFYISQAL